MKPTTQYRVTQDTTVFAGSGQAVGLATKGEILTVERVAAGNVYFRADGRVLYWVQAAHTVAC